MLPVLLAALVALEAASPAPAPPSPPAAPRAPAPPSPPALPGAAAPPRARHEVGPGDRLLGDWPAAASGKKVTLQDKLDVDEALERISAAAGWNLVANTGRAGDRTLVLNLRNVPVEEALEAVLGGSSLVATRRGKTVTVAPRLPSRPRVEADVLTGFDRPSGKRFSGDFKNAPVARALRRIADAGGLSLVLPPGLQGAVSAHFKDVAVEDALRAVLAQADLTAALRGGVLTVSREGGPRIVISGGRRRLEFGPEDLPDAEEVRELAEEAVEEARQAVEDAKEEPGTPRRGRRAPDRVTRGDVAVAAGERVRDVVALRGNVKLEAGAVAREVTAVLGSVEIGPGASVSGSVTAVGGDLHVAAGARVGQDATSVGGRLVIEPGGQVEGNQTAVPVPGLAALLGLALGAGGFSSDVSPALKVGQTIAEFAVLFALGLVILVLFPRRLSGVEASLEASPLKALLAGLLGTVAMPVLTVLLAVTIVGIPLIAVQILGVLVAAVLGFSALAVLVGRRLPFRLERGAAVIQLAVGTAAIVLVTKIPVLGVLAWVAGWLFVFGAVLRTRFGQPTPPEPLPTTAVSAPPSPPPAAAAS